MIPQPLADLAIDLLLSNLAASTTIAAAALLAHRKLPALAHLLWALALLKLLTPPLYTLPVAPPATTPAAPIATAFTAPIEASPLTFTAPPFSASAAPSDPFPWFAVLAVAWVLGSAVVLTVSLARIHRFRALLRRTARPAPPSVRALAKQPARALRLRRVPTILTTSANLPPMVWSFFCRPVVVLPSRLINDLTPDELLLIIAHELAHIRRRDHLTRTLEWLATVAFWWNPITHLARNRLRATEEICCDALVIRALSAPPKSYANALMRALEQLVAHAQRTPSPHVPKLASQINTGGDLTRRFHMILSHKPAPKLRRAAALAITLALLPAGVAFAGTDFQSIGERLRNAISEGELTPEQARTMMQALRKSEYEAIEKKIWAAYKAGDITEREAKRKLAAVEKELFGDKAMKENAEKAKAKNKEKDKDKRAGAEQREREMKVAMERVAAAKQEIRTALQNGEITEDEAREKAAALDARVAAMKAERNKTDNKADNNAGVRERLARAKKELWAAVEAGRITEEEAKARYAEMQRAAEAAMSNKADRKSEPTNNLREQYAKAQAELEQAVNNGRITEREARQRLEQIRERLTAESQRRERESNRIRDERKERNQRKDTNDREARTITEETYWRAAAEMWQAVAQGKMTAEEVEAKLAVMRKHM